jgi:Leucine-rich repeat (LRR) protein
MASSTCTGSSANLSNAECAVWLSLYDKTGGRKLWTHCQGDRSDPCACSYSIASGTHGVGCTDNHITSLDLAHNTMVGTIPDGIADLKALTSLALSDNKVCSQYP